MEINLSKAVKQFFPNPSLEMVYFEAVANSIDAGASNINISIKINSYSDSETLQISISDDGCGITERNFKKFSKLLETEEDDHKGLGRLVFLNYFRNIEIKSTFIDKIRTFTFSPKFNGESNIAPSEQSKSGTRLDFRGYSKKTIKTYDYLKPISIKKALELHFFPKFHLIKREDEKLKIKITLETNEPNSENNFHNDTQIIDVQKIPELTKLTFSADPIKMFEELELFYDIKQTNGEKSVVTAICAEGRTIPLDIIPKENTPDGYEIIFLLYSKIFDGKVNNSRQKLELDDDIFKGVKRLFINKIGEILTKKIPIIADKNSKVKKSLDDRYPHLLGLFDDNSIGLIDRNKALELAQKKYFSDQKEILEAQSLTDTQYEKSIKISSRILTEYVLYRSLTINKMKSLDRTKSESSIHKLIVPMRKTLRKENFISDIYSNNAWILDDKYMSYNTILSDQEMSKVLSELDTGLKADKPDARPDLTIVFSENPNDINHKVDVVVVELKKEGVDLAKKENVVSQLKQRARELCKLYPNKIQRMWFYGIIDFDDDIKISLLEDKFKELYSSDSMFYKDHEVITDLKKDIRVQVGLYVMSYKSLLSDAESRNSTFLKILKDGIKNSVEQNDTEHNTSNHTATLKMEKV